MAAANTIIEALAEWVGSQRWFTGGGMRPRLTLIASVSMHRDANCRVRTLVVSDDGGADPVFYQVPIVLRRTRRQDSDLGFIGVVNDEGGEWFAYDGPADSAYTAPLLTLLMHGGSLGDAEGSSARIFASAGKPLTDQSLQSAVLTGEQSNTSIVYSTPAGPLIICKIFRMLHHGENPDVVVQSELFRAGSTSVPELIGSASGEWPDGQQPDGRARGHLAFAQRFLAGAEDGWTRALDAVALDADFTTSARRIGVAVADVHTTLATAMPTRAATEEDAATIVFSWQRRLDSAIAEVPELEPTRTPIESLYRRAEATPWPRLQRVHGDLHLGQLLATDDDTWTIIDFEGEPMRPLEERSQPDIVLRDIAGMLRSFDYAAGSHAAAPGSLEWARACRTAFLDGYIERSAHDVRQNRDLLDAFEIDKALYEVVYENHNRPAWLPVPIAAVRRLAERVEQR